MVKLTLIARVADGLPLAEGLETEKNADLDAYKQQAKARAARYTDTATCSRTRTDALQAAGGWRPPAAAYERRVGRILLPVRLVCSWFLAAAHICLSLATSSSTVCAT